MAIRSDPIVSIQEISRRSGVSASKLRYYEELGLLLSKRRDSPHRRYTVSTLDRINYITCAQRAGFSLEEIAEHLAQLPINRAPTQKDWAPLSRLWRPRIDERIAELEQLKIELEQCACAASAEEDARETKGHRPLRHKVNIKR